MKLKEQFLPYELAVKLREKGFNETCIALITEKDFLIPLRFDDEEELEFNQEIKKHNNVPCIPTPLYKQVTDWLRKKHKIGLNIVEIGDDFKIHYKKNSSENMPNFLWHLTNKKGETHNTLGGGDNNYLKCFNKAIIQILKLI